jgi:hypothetical protein
VVVSRGPRAEGRLGGWQSAEKLASRGKTIMRKTHTDRTGVFHLKRHLLIPKAFTEPNILENRYGRL